MGWRKKDIDISEPANQQLLKIMRFLDFKQEQHAYKFCFSMAILNELDKPSTNFFGKRNTKWARGNFDDKSYFESFLIALHGEDADLSSVLENTAEAGIEFVSNILEDDQFYEISEIMNYGR